MVASFLPVALTTQGKAKYTTLAATKSINSAGITTGGMNQLVDSPGSCFNESLVGDIKVYSLMRRPGRRLLQQIL
jgi:hypothetical protein